MKITLEPQQIQEEQYVFPYHYVPSLQDGNFRLHVFWSWGLNYLSSTEFLLELLQSEEFNSLADVGCGDGRFLRELSQVFPNKSLCGVDFSDRAINLAKALNPALDFRCLDITQEHQLGHFDVVTSIEVIEHIPQHELDSFISSMANLQQPGGRLILTAPHSNMGLQKKHFQHFSRDSLERALCHYYTIERYLFFDKRSRRVRYLRALLKNRFAVLNYQPLLNWVYKTYKRQGFHCTETDCNRVGAVARRL
jgi:2-polyprenyl-3-methyl-5-hydroxy-6-metoxy-1,4-benzoquinol methylase